MESKAILHLTLKKKWFDMILSGWKKEEYRAIKMYWIRRLLNHSHSTCKGVDNISHVFLPKEFESIKITNGYARNAPWFIVECKGIDVGPAVPEWSDNWPGDVFRIKLGEIIDGNCIVDCNLGNNHIIPNDKRVRVVNE